MRRYTTQLNIPFLFFVSEYLNRSPIQERNQLKLLFEEFETDIDAPEKKNFERHRPLESKHCSQ
jgi:hypothetical protein